VNRNEHVNADVSRPYRGGEDDASDFETQVAMATD
jgi:hypothetical protein